MVTVHLAEPKPGTGSHGMKWKSFIRTSLYHSQLDVLGDGDRRSEEVKLELAMYVTLIDTTVIVRDVEDYNGDILQVLTPIPEQATLQWSVQFKPRVILIYINLKERKGKQMYIKYLH